MRVPRAAISGEEEIREICEAFKGIGEDLVWYRSEMPCYAQIASDNFPMGHVNAMIYGPIGLVLSEKLRVGVSLLAPFVRHSDHHHRAKEMYLVVSEGEFRQGEGEWVSPGNRGTLYNPSHIVHAMR
ncbi:dimethylsulfoniopropionate lyase [Pseudomonas urmiensis]|uniref:Dimethylsulfoniopropionate lyase n=1 Tax=Pseudomonas urmiensis TaxID=2745493 RepID=A0ABW8NQS3_9PSED